MTPVAGARQAITRRAGAPRVLFLPGAGGDGEFWCPVARLLPAQWEKLGLSWPGLGDQPHDPSIRDLDDLVAIVAAALTRPSDLVAQSIGGVVAIRVAAEHPDRVRRLVLAVTSGGIGLDRHGAEDWRAEYRATYPHAVSWITEPVSDQSAAIAAIGAPTLLLWGDEDPISPVSVGAELARLLPSATLYVINGGTHSVARDQPELVARLVWAHLAP